MKRCFLAVFLSVFLAVPQGAFASAGETAAGEGRPSWMGGPFFWGALVLLNGTILTSSIGDLRFYESRADEIAAEGGDAGAYWDAASREKVTIGISALSLVFSLAGLKGSFSGSASPVAIPPPPPEATLPTPPGPVQVLSLESRVRYDTLFTPDSDSERVGEEPKGLVVSVSPLGRSGADASGMSIGDTTVAGPSPEGAVLAKNTPADAPPGETPSLGKNELAGILASLEESVPPLGRDSVPAVPNGEPSEEETPTFALLPYGVHVSSFRTQALAEKDEAVWLERGETVTIEEDEVQGKGTWFRVLLGNFETPAEASAYAETLRARYALDYAQPHRRNGF